MNSQQNLQVARPELLVFCDELSLVLLLGQQSKTLKRVNWDAGISKHFGISMDFMCLGCCTIDCLLACLLLGLASISSRAMQILSYARFQTSMVSTSSCKPVEQIPMWFPRPQPTFITKTRTHFRMSRSTFLWSQSENHLVSSSALNTFYTCFGATKPIGWCLSIGKPHGFNQLLQLLYPGLEQIADGTHGPLRVPSPGVHLKLRHLAPAEIWISREAEQIKPFSTCQLFRSTTIIENQ